MIEAAKLIANEVNDFNFGPLDFTYPEKFNRVTIGPVHKFEHINMSKFLKDRLLLRGWKVISDKDFTDEKNGTLTHTFTKDKDEIRVKFKFNPDFAVMQVDFKGFDARHAKREMLLGIARLHLRRKKRGD